MRKLLLLLTLSVVALQAACGGDDQAAVGADEAADVPPAAVYSVRGRVAELPPAGQPRDWLVVKHEAIPDFVGIDGEVDPMHAMTMRFTVDEAVEMEGIAVGDKVTLELEVDWGGGELARIVGLSPLPEDTELELAGG